MIRRVIPNALADLLIPLFLYVFVLAESADI